MGVRLQQLSSHGVCKTVHDPTDSNTPCVPLSTAKSNADWSSRHDVKHSSVTAYQNVTLDSSDVLSIGRFCSATNDVDPVVERTTAHSYGVEFLVRRAFSESLAGWFAYTLSRSTRSVGRSSGTSSFDRTHVLNLAAAYDLGSRWRLGGRLMTYSGIPASVGAVSALAMPPRTSWFYRIDWRLEERWALEEVVGG